MRMKPMWAHSMLRKSVYGTIGKWASKLRARGRPERRFRIGILKTDRLGDSVLALGAIRLLASQFGEENCVLIASNWGASLFAREFPRMALIEVPSYTSHRRLLDSAYGLRQQFGDVMCEYVVCLRHQRADWDDIVLSWCGGRNSYVLKPSAKSCLGKGAIGRMFYNRSLTEVCETSEECIPIRANREILRHMILLGNLLGRKIEFDEVCPSFTSCRRKHLESKYVLVCPFGSSRIRDFPVEALGETLREISRHTNAAIRLQADESRRGDLLVLANLLSNSYSLEVECGKALCLAEYIDEIFHTEVIVTIDSAAAHIATALDKRAIILHGDAQPNEFVPWGEQKRQRWITKSMPCQGCNWICVHDRPLCITSVSPTTLKEAVTAVFRED